MNKKKRNMILLAAALVILVIVYMAVMEMNKRSEEAADTSVALYSGEVSNITEVIIQNSDEASPFFHIAKTDGQWSSQTDSSRELDSDKVSTELTDLTQLTADQMAAENAEDMSEYGLDTPVTTLTISDDTGTQVWYFGDKNSVTNQYYVYKEGETTVYAVSLNTYNIVISENEADLVVETETETETETEETESDTSSVTDETSEN